ncbi:MAG: hypothetical protein ACLQVJ_05355 [Syntrophobacteraceae bacterium]
MSAQSILDQLRDIGVAVSIEGGLIAVKPASGLTPELWQAIPGHKAELLTLLVPKSYWNRLAGTKANPDEAWEEQDIIFLTACEIFREADSGEHLLARWSGYKCWLSKNLSEAAMLALSDLFSSLRGTKHGLGSNEPNGATPEEHLENHENQEADATRRDK